MSRINTSKTDISSDCWTIQVLVVVRAAVSFQDICDIEPRTRWVAVVVMAIGHTGQRPGTLSVVGNSAGQGTQNAEPRVAGSLHRIRPVARRERPVVAVAGAAVIAVGRAGLCSHLACNERSREHRCRTTRTNTDGEALSFWSLSRASYYERSTTERRRSVMRTTTSETFDIDCQHQKSTADVYCWWRTSSHNGRQESTRNCAQKTKRDSSDDGMRTKTKKINNNDDMIITNNNNNTTKITTKTVLM